MKMSEGWLMFWVLGLGLALLFGSYVLDVQADKAAGRLVPYEGSEHIPMGQ